MSEALLTPEAQLPELTHELFANTLSAIGNDERKALLTVLLPDDQYLRYSEADAILVDAQGTKPVWKIGSGQGHRYCRDSLEPVGLAAQAIRNSDGDPILFKKTTHGAIYGEAIAGAVLAYSLKSDSIPLQSLFGRTSASTEADSRGPFNTLEVIEDLLISSGPQRTSTIAGHVDIVPSDTLRRLNEQGVINYEHREIDETFANYAAGDSFEAGIETRTRNGRDLTESAIAAASRLLSEKTHFDIEELIAEIPEEILHNQPGDVDIKRQLYQLLRRATQQGFLQHHGEITPDLRSYSEIKPEHKDSLTQLVNDLESIIAGDEDAIKGLREQAHAIASDAGSVKKLFRKGLEGSPFTKRRSRTGVAATIAQMVPLSGEGKEITGAEVRSRLAEIGIEYSAHSVNSILRALVEQGVITPKKIKGRNHFSKVEAES